MNNLIYLHAIPSEFVPSGYRYNVIMTLMEAHQFLMRHQEFCTVKVQGIDWFLDTVIA